MRGAEVVICEHCAGKGAGWVTDPDADDSRTYAMCEVCEGDGRVVVCAEPACGERYPLKEAAREGIWCEACRHALDGADQADAMTRRAS